MLQKKWLLMLLVVALGIAIVGVANATTIKNSFADQSPSITVSSAAVSTDQVNQMIKNCWQFNQALVDQWVKTSGLSQQDLIKMEQSWLQGVMQQNPSLTLQEALKMEQTWLLNNMANYKTVAITPQQTQPQQVQIQQVQPTQQVQQPAVSPQTPPAPKTYQTPYYGNRNYSYGNGRYSNWNCGW